MIHFEGFLLGISTFAVIGLFHPIVVHTHYHFGTRPWWVFALFGLACAGGALFVANVFVSALLGIVGFSSLWTVKELFEQEERVRKGWFPANPRRRAGHASRRGGRRQSGDAKTPLS